MPGSRLSLASFVSSEISPGEHPNRASSSLSFPGRPSGYFDFAERRKRLATFLDETAEAMEGGKSLEMVLPEGSNRPLSQFVEPPSPTDQSHQFPSGVSERPGHRGTVYFTPVLGERSSSDDTVASEEADLRVDQRDLTGLGLDSTPALNMGLEASPATLRGGSPSGFDNSSAPGARQQEVDVDNRRDAALQDGKVAEKRRRTIKELIETEMAYAVDMMVVRDIYLARAKGARTFILHSHSKLKCLRLTNLLCFARHDADRRLRDEQWSWARCLRRWKVLVACVTDFGNFRESFFCPKRTSSIHVRVDQRPIVGAAEPHAGTTAHVEQGHPHHLREPGGDRFAGRSFRRNARSRGRRRHGRNARSDRRNIPRNGKHISVPSILSYDS